MAEIASADAQLVHDLEVQIRRVMFFLRPTAVGNQDEEGGSPVLFSVPPERCRAAYESAVMATLLLERRIRDQLDHYLPVTAQEITNG